MQGGEWRYVVGILFGCVLLFGGCAATHNVEYATGYRDGVIQKASVKGWPWRTRECELAMDGMRIRGSGDGVKGGNVFACSVIDADVWAKVESLSPGQQVRVRYSQKWWLAPWVGRTSYVVTSVETQ